MRSGPGRSCRYIDVLKRDTGARPSSPWLLLFWRPREGIEELGSGRQGWGTELFLRCMEHRNELPITKKMSNGGERLIKKAHKRSVEEALKAGQDVRQEVLADYGLTRPAP
jgi:hypothetical protein